MSTDKLVLSGDYYVQTANSGTITLDTGAAVGSVIITGNLEVRGTTTEIESTNATIKDNIIVLNQGEINVGQVTLGTSGLKISRDPVDSDANAVTLLWNNTRPWTTGDGSGSGIWTLRNNATYQGIEVGFIKLNSALGPSNATSKNWILTDGLVNLSINDGNYNSRLLSVAPDISDTDIPTKGYVDYRLANIGSIGTATNARYIQVGNSAVMINDQSENPSTASHITTYIDTISNFEVYVNSVNMPNIDLRFTQSSIQSQATNTNLTLLTNGTGVVEVRNGIAFVAPVSPTWTPPVPEVGMTKVYSTTTPGSGSTGLLFNHSDGTNIIQGELISARKALLLGIIF
jgi:hypothetical protein